MSLFARLVSIYSCSSHSKVVMSQEDGPMAMWAGIGLYLSHAGGKVLQDLRPHLSQQGVSTNRTVTHSTFLFFCSILCKFV